MQSFTDLRGLYENVNNIFGRRIEETMEAKRKLERELARVRLYRLSDTLFMFTSFSITL